jgi:hypothetical protein
MTSPALKPYFAAPEVKAEDIASRCWDKVAGFFDWAKTSGRAALVRKMGAETIGAKVNGTGSVSWAVTEGGDAGELLHSKENHFASVGTALLNLTSAQRPAVQCSAANTDKKSLAQTQLANGLIEYHLDSGLERLLKRAVKRAIFGLEGFIEAAWDANAGDAVTPSDPESFVASLPAPPTADAGPVTSKEIGPTPGAGAAAALNAPAPR